MRRVVCSAAASAARDSPGVVDEVDDSPEQPRGQVLPLAHQERAHGVPRLRGAEVLWRRLRARERRIMRTTNLRPNAQPGVAAEPRALIMSASSSATSWPRIPKISTHHASPSASAMILSATWRHGRTASIASCGGNDPVAGARRANARRDAVWLAAPHLPLLTRRHGGCHFEKATNSVLRAQAGALAVSGALTTTQRRLPAQKRRTCNLMHPVDDPARRAVPSETFPRHS